MSASRDKLTTALSGVLKLMDAPAIASVHMWWPLVLNEADNFRLISLSAFVVDNRSFFTIFKLGVRTGYPAVQTDCI